MLLISILIMAFNFNSIYSKKCTCSGKGHNNIKMKAVAFLTGSGSVKGNITLSQEKESSPIRIHVSLIGLPPGGKHGFHIHEFGDISGGCASTGGHYNPFNKTHGAPTAKERHVGDLGNVQADAYGSVSVTFTDSQFSLYGPCSVLGRGIVLHNGTDDLGLGGHNLSMTTGNAGARLACGVIGLSKI